MNYRNLRLGGLIQEELGKIFARDMEFPAFVTIVDVEVSKKLDTAKVRVSVIPEVKAKEVYDLLQNERRLLQFKLLRTLNIKPMPRLEFGLIRGEEAMVEKEEK
ncbi:MAG: ribosome-binding factor A [Candidatus Liptonbacteria bacterium]|nr:ribosome-binding factor A [Candidatus Liptonbacteria bacterium]